MFQEKKIIIIISSFNGVMLIFHEKVLYIKQFDTKTDTYQNIGTKTCQTKRHAVVITLLETHHRCQN